jgi:D-sedoheptulose 7-phosphate isomerase
MTNFAPGTTSSSIDLLAQRIKSSIEIKQMLLEDIALLTVAAEVAHIIVVSLSAGGKVFFFGNGGSSMDSGHLAAELMGRFYVDRIPLAAVSLADSTAALTAISNDYSFSDVFARQLRGLGRTGDVAIGLTTSGNSQNVVAALSAARELGMKAVAMTGERPGAAGSAADFVIAIPSFDTPRVQECQMLVGHTICELVERAMVSDSE